MAGWVNLVSQSIWWHELFGDCLVSAPLDCRFHSEINGGRIQGADGFVVASEQPLPSIEESEGQQTFHTIHHCRDMIGVGLGRASGWIMTMVVGCVYRTLFHPKPTKFGGAISFTESGSGFISITFREGGWLHRFQLISKMNASSFFTESDPMENQGSSGGYGRAPERLHEGGSHKWLAWFGGGLRIRIYFFKRTWAFPAAFFPWVGGTCTRILPRHFKF